MNANPEQLTRKELADFYEKLVLLWENGDLLHQNFNIRSSKNYRRLKDKYDFDIKALSNLQETAESFEKIGISLEGGKSVVYLHNAKGNVLKSYFYHMRNAAAHADIRKTTFKRRNWYIFEHKHRNQIKMFGQFRTTDFIKVHDELIKLRGKKK